jgi:hypothetical protein
MARPKLSKETTRSSATIGFEPNLWLTVDKETFEQHRAKLHAGECDYTGAEGEVPDEYKAETDFWLAGGEVTHGSDVLLGRIDRLGVQQFARYAMEIHP